MRETVSDGVLFTGEKYPKAAMGQQAQIGFYKPYAPVSPWYPLSEYVRRRWSSMTHQT